MSSPAVKLDALIDRYPGSFADHVDYNHGPRGALGRYMLAAEARLDDIGITLKRVDPTEMVKLNRASQSSWWRQVPVLDAEDFPSTGDELMCWIGYDRSGNPVTANSMRLLDLKGATLKDEMESLRLFFGPRAEEMRSSVEFEITAPYATLPQQHIVYTGGFWVDPSMRGAGLSMVVPKISYLVAIAHWGAPVSLSIVRHVFLKPEAASNYNVEASEEGFTFKTNGRILWDGVLVWMTRPYLEARIELEIDRLKALGSADHGRRQQTLPALDLRRKQQS